MGWFGYIDPRAELVFFWSQKAACSTLFSLLADNMPQRPASNAYFHRQSKSTKVCLKAIETEGYRSVILVRHPVLRCISAYFNKFCVYRGRRLERRDDLEVFAQALHDHWCAQTGRETDDNLMSFEEFLDAVASLHNGRPKPWLPVNGHWETQTPPWLVERGFRYDHVICVEDADAGLLALADRYGLRYAPRRVNSTPVVQNEGRVPYMGAVPAREVGAQPFGYRNFVAPQTRERIRALYDVDFRAFGYPTDPFPAKRSEAA